MSNTNKRLVIKVAGAAGQGINGNSLLQFGNAWESAYIRRQDLALSKRGET